MGDQNAGFGSPQTAGSQAAGAVRPMFNRTPHKGARQAASSWRPDWLITDDPYQLLSDRGQQNALNESKAPDGRVQ